MLLDQLSAVDQAAGKVVVIATTRCRQDLHQLLLQSRGSHVFEQVMEILPPDLVSDERHVCLFVCCFYFGLVVCLKFVN